MKNISGSRDEKDNAGKQGDNNPCKWLNHPEGEPRSFEDWVPYEDETCIKAFILSNKTYKEAKEYCQNSHRDADLVSIDSRHKQEFIEKYIKSKKVLNQNIWIGLTHQENGIYKWADESDYVYKNWAPGSPKNKSDHCVKIQTAEDAYFGKWNDVLCTDTSAIFVMCENIQTLWSPKRIQRKITKLYKNPVPIGFIYVQLPKEKPPKDIWPTLTWKNISSDYAGVFFRVEGGNSSSFGKTQEGIAPRIVAVASAKRDYELPTYLSLELGSWSARVFTGSGTCHPGGKCSNVGLNFYTTSVEVRPSNMAVRIWKRTE